MVILLVIVVEFIFVYITLIVYITIFVFMVLDFVGFFPQIVSIFFTFSGFQN